MRWPWLCLLLRLQHATDPLVQPQDCRQAWSCLYHHGPSSLDDYPIYTYRILLLLNHAYPIFTPSIPAPYSPPSQVAGESGLGKTTFINTLFSTTIKNYADHRRRHQKQIDKTVEIEITKAELEEKFFKGVFVLILSSLS